MRPYFTKAGKQQFKPSFEEIETMDWDGLGLCLACGETQPAEPDVRQYECDCCGERKVYGAAELALSGLYYHDKE